MKLKIVATALIFIVFATIACSKSGCWLVMVAGGSQSCEIGSQNSLTK